MCFPSAIYLHLKGPWLVKSTAGGLAKMRCHWLGHGAVVLRFRVAFMSKYTRRVETAQA